MLARLETLIPGELGEFFRLSHSHGFTVMLVGGAVRDLLMNQAEIKDWDFELFHSNGNQARWKSFLKELSEDYQLNPESHQVMRAKKSGVEFQFAPPRRETYASKDTFGHGEFESESDWKLSFAEAANRRDFTINAMGARLVGKTWELVDPFGGFEHLKQKLLIPCDRAHFMKDPVRLLRAHRFAMKYQLQFAGELAELLEQMDLSYLSPFYVSEEARKSGTPFLFWNQLQGHHTLPPKFQGGLLAPLKLESVYSRNLAGFGHSNALLAAVFTIGEGWHLLQALAGKGEHETTLWRQRRETILQLSGLSFNEGQSDDELIHDENFIKLMQLTRPPLTWWQFDWVKDVFNEHRLNWVLTKVWPEKMDLSQFPQDERQARKVLAWLRS
jgi:hypothetical protein